MPKKKVSFKHLIEYVFFSGYINSIRLSPIAFIPLHRLWLRFLFTLIGRRHSAIVTRNLELAFPGKNSREISRLKKKIYRHFSTIFTQVITLFVKKKPEKILPPIIINNRRILDKILKLGKGVILFSAHFGNWELAPFIISREINKKTYNIARRMDNPLIEKKVTEFRKYMGSHIIYKKGSIKTILKELKRNQVIGMIIDQNTLPEEGVFVDFFSHKVCAIPSVAQIHLKWNIPIVPVFIHYEPGQIVCDILEEVGFKKSDDFKKDVVDLTQICNTLIEEKIRQYPEQWFWFHNRWKNQPQGDSHET
jgi:KDO2-lipid IV(A) lauroyltransferase